MSQTAHNAESAASFPTLTAAVDPGPAIVVLTLEQSRAALLKVEDSSGQTRCYLVNDPHATLAFTPAEFADIQERAANPIPGALLREILREAQAKVGP